MTTPTEAEELKADQVTVRNLSISVDVCPRTGIMLTKKTTVVVYTWYSGPDRDPTIDVIHFEAWEQIKEKFRRLCKTRKHEYKVLDGRELF